MSGPDPKYLELRSVPVLQPENEGTLTEHHHSTSFLHESPSNVTQYGTRRRVTRDEHHVPICVHGSPFKDSHRAIWRVHVATSGEDIWWIGELDH